LGKEYIRGDIMANILNKFKYFIGLDDLEEEDLEEQEEELEPVTTKTSKVNNKVVNIHTNSNMKLVVHEPLSYEDAPKVIDDLKMRKTVIINLEGLELEAKKQIFDFINGGLYALEGNIQKVTKDIFVVAPNNVEIDGNVKDEIRSKGLFSWQNK
jgi:cell division inhibitor SepF